MSVSAVWAVPEWSMHSRFAECGWQVFDALPVVLSLVLHAALPAAGALCN